MHKNILILFLDSRMPSMMKLKIKSKQDTMCLQAKTQLTQSSNVHKFTSTPKRSRETYVIQAQHPDKARRIVHAGENVIKRSCNDIIQQYLDGK